MALVLMFRSCRGRGYRGRRCGIRWCFRLLRTGHPVSDMFIEYSPELFDREGMPLAGVPRANDELGFHPLDMGAPVLHDAVIACLDLLPGTAAVNIVSPESPVLRT